MTYLVASLLLILALLDGSFAGFRSSIGRSGLIDHRQSDRRAACRGLGLVLILLSPVMIIAVVDVATRPERLPVYLRAGSAMVLIYLPYASVVGAALLVYLLLAWRWKYLASAVILGPGTLLRPVVAVAGGVVGVIVTGDVVLTVLIIGAVSAVLAVEPLLDRLVYGEVAR